MCIVWHERSYALLMETKEAQLKDFVFSTVTTDIKN